MNGVSSVKVIEISYETLVPIPKLYHVRVWSFTLVRILAQSYSSGESRKHLTFDSLFKLREHTVQKA